MPGFNKMEKVMRPEILERQSSSGFAQFRNAIESAIYAFARFMRNRREHEKLNELSDEMLRDIGLTKFDSERLSRKPAITHVSWFDR